jgi:Asp/Glu/hydantoin racemase
MKIWFQALSANPEIDPAWRAYDEACLRYVPALARPDTQIHFASTDTRAPKMVLSAYVKYLHLAQVIENAIRAEKAGYDAFVIGGVGDLGHDELKEVVDIPVVFIGETSFLVASLLATKFAIINSDTRSLQAATAMVRKYGLEERMVPGAHVGQSQTAHFAQFEKDPQRAVADIKAAARAPINEGAAMLIPGTAPISVFLAEQGVREIDGVPILDLHAAVIKATEMAVDFRRLGIPKSRKGPAFDVNKDDIVLARKIYGLP